MVSVIFLRNLYVICLHTKFSKSEYCKKKMTVLRRRERGRGEERKMLYITKLCLWLNQLETNLDS